MAATISWEDFSSLLAEWEANGIWNVIYVAPSANEMGHELYLHANLHRITGSELYEKLVALLKDYFGSIKTVKDVMIERLVTDEDMDGYVTGTFKAVVDGVLRIDGELWEEPFHSHAVVEVVIKLTELAKWSLGKELQLPEEDTDEASPWDDEPWAGNDEVML